MLKRRKEQRTNYLRRLKSLKSSQPRLVVKRTGSYIHAQIVIYEPTGDKTQVEQFSRSLKKFGWHGNTANTSAAYLLGMLVGFEARKQGITEANMDIGLQTSNKQSVLFAVAAGANDAGLNVPVGKEILPTPQRIRGEHIAAFAQKLKKENEKKYHTYFSAYLKSPIKPEEIAMHFEDVKNKIIASYKGVAHAEGAV